jgi:hypothetical protein
LLSIVETLKEFRTILLGQQLIVHTDQENLTYKHFNSDGVMQWRLYIEEYSPNLRYIKDTKNVAADALFCRGILNSPMNEAHLTEALRSELYAFNDEDLPTTAFPLSYAFLGKAQSTDIAILKETAKRKHFTKSNPSQGEERQENSFATTARLWSQRNCKQESFDGTTITLDIPVPIKLKKPLVNTTSGGLK